VADPGQQGATLVIQQEGINRQETVRVSMPQQKVCFFDADPVERSTNVSRIVHQAEKHPDNPIVTATEPWEFNRDSDSAEDADHAGGNVYLMGTVTHDQEEGCYKMWYRTYPPDSDALTLYAESEDGLEWEKPELGVFEWEGSTENNIVADVPKIPCIFKDATATDPDETYKWFSYYFRDGGQNLVFHSPDGIDWTEYDESPAHTRDAYPNLEDASSGFYDPYTEQFVGTAQMGTSDGHQRGRSVYTTTSGDFREWSPPRVALTEDARDRELVENRGGERADYYYLTGLAYEACWLGFAHFYEVGVTETADSGDGPIEPRLAISRDRGETWEKTWHTAGGADAIIPRGSPGEFDHGMIFTATQPIVKDDEIVLYYGGISKGHGASGSRRAIGMATLPLDRFVSYRSTGSGGTVTTAPLTVTDEDLLVNADPTVGGADGSVRVELLRPDADIPLRGYDREACVPIESDGLRNRVQWEDPDVKATRSDVRNLERLVGHEVRVRFYLDHADLYTLTFS